MISSFIEQEHATTRTVTGTDKRQARPRWDVAQPLFALTRGLRSWMEEETRQEHSDRSAHSDQRRGTTIEEIPFMHRARGTDHIDISSPHHRAEHQSEIDAIAKPNGTGARQHHWPLRSAAAVACIFCAMVLSGAPSAAPVAAAVPATDPCQEPLLWAPPAAQD